MSNKKSCDVNHKPIGPEKTDGKEFDPELEILELDDDDLEKVSGGCKDDDPCIQNEGE